MTGVVVGLGGNALLRDAHLISARCPGRTMMQQSCQVDVANVTDGNTQPRLASTVTYMPVSSTVVAS